MNEHSAANTIEHIERYRIADMTLGFIAGVLLGGLVTMLLSGCAHLS